VLSDFIYKNNHKKCTCTSCLLKSLNYDTNKVIPDKTMILKQNLTQKVQAFIKEKIGSGLYKPGALIPSEREMSELLEVSRVTVRRAMKQLIEENLLQAESKKGYMVPFLISSVTKKSRVGPILFIHGFSEEEMSDDREHLDLWAGARMECAKQGQMILICSLPDLDRKISKIDDLLKTAGGVICDITDDAFIKKIQKRGLPVLQIHSAGKSDEIDRVIQDDYMGIEKSYSYLYDKGYRKIAYFDCSKSLREQKREGNSEKRLASYLLNCQKDSQAPLIIDIDFFNIPTMTKALLPEKMDAVIVPHMELWESFHPYFKKNKKLGIVLWGFEEGLNEGVSANILWSKKEMGATAVRRLFARMKQPQLLPGKIIISTKLVEVNLR